MWSCAQLRSAAQVDKLHIYEDCAKIWIQIKHKLLGTKI